MRKRLLSTLPALMLCLTLCVPASAAGPGGDAVTYSVPISTEIKDFDSLGDTSIVSVSIPTGIQRIGEGAFMDCINMREIGLPSTLTSIGKDAFRGCVSLTDVYFDGTRTQWDTIKIDNSGNYNNPLLSATIHYSSSGDDAPSAPAESSTPETPSVPETPSTPTTPSAPAASEPPTKFTDVAATSPFADAIIWAAGENITTGKTATTFAPGEECTRGQILTFLWRANGSPEPTIENPFTDSIPASFQKAAIWAYEKGLVSGTEFGSSTPCTRAMTVEYLWKAAGSPSFSGNAGFNDVPANAGYVQAVMWAVEFGVTSGTGDGSTFSPDNTCTRGQIVTFLYRAIGK